MLFGRNKGSLYRDTVLSCDVVAVPVWCHVCVSVDCCLPITCVTMETTTVLYLQGERLCPCPYLFHCPSCHTLLLSFPFLPPPILSPPSLSPPFLSPPLPLHSPPLPPFHALTKSSNIQQKFAQHSESIKNHEDDDEDVKVCTVEHNLHTTTPSVRV